MTASLYGVMFFVSSVGLLTGLTLVSATHAASGSPVIIGIVMPLPGRVTFLASLITADSSCVF